MLKAPEFCLAGKSGGGPPGSCRPGKTSPPTRRRMICPRSPSRTLARDGVADVLITLEPFLVHTEQHGNVAVRVIEYLHNLFARMQAVQPASILLDRPAPRHWQRQEQRVQASIIESLPDIAASRNQYSRLVIRDRRK